jgi:hypothetical protein
MQESQNFGLAGGTLRVDISGRELAFALTGESSCDDEYVRWSPVHARLYVEMLIDELEFHANWGV